MDSGQHRPTPGGWTIDDGVSEYLDSIESGNYRRSVESTLTSWGKWLDTERGVEDLDEITVLDCRHYARYLKQSVRKGDLKASTARTYYAIVRAVLGFCVDEEALSSNPAAVQRAVDELPEETGDVDRQFWTEEHRNQILEYVDDRARRALDEEASIDRVVAFRDRAIVYTLALGGFRAGEVFRDPADSMRNGVRWGTLDVEAGTLRVFGKSREYEYAQVPSQAVDVLERYRKVLNPVSDEWPLFPSFHGPSLYRVVREQLPEQGVSEEHVETLLEEHTVMEVVREYELVPSGLSKSGARNLVQNLCDEAGIEIDGEPLKLHGARRGLGHELYKEGHAELAQSALRHSSIEVTHESYSNIRASETAEQVGDVLNARDDDALR